MQRFTSALNTSVMQKLAVLLEMIKFQHTVFALPFALIGMLLAARGVPSWWTITWILACCVFARTTAMAFNRWADAELDARNPRTASRAIPAGQLTKPMVLVVAVVSSALFIGSAAMLNKLAFALSPVTLLVLLGYSYCKRFTSASHFVLGLALGIAPVGAWVAVRGEIGLVPLLLCTAVLLWTAGFDLIYACQDVEVDRQQGLFSIPARYGPANALLLSRVLHIACLVALLLVGKSAALHLPYWLGVGAVAALLLAEHLVVDAHDLRRIELAFFTINSWVGVVLLAFTSWDILAYR